MPGIYQQLVVWQRSIQLTVELYRITALFPRTELYGLVVQLRRATVSVASNIAEGQGRRTRGEALQFLGQARGSLQEVETQLVVARELGFIDAATWARLDATIVEISRPLAGLMRSTAEGRK